LESVVFWHLAVTDTDQCLNIDHVPLEQFGSIICRFRNVASYWSKALFLGRLF